MFNTAEYFETVNSTYMFNWKVKVNKKRIKFTRCKFNKFRKQKQRNISKFSLCFHFITEAAF